MWLLYYVFYGKYRNEGEIKKSTAIGYIMHACILKLRQHSLLVRGLERNQGSVRCK